MRAHGETASAPAARGVWVSGRRGPGERVGDVQDVSPSMPVGEPVAKRPR